MSRFTNPLSLRNAGGRARRAVESLVTSDAEPEPESYSRASTNVYSVDFDVSRPKDEIEDYWRLYETNPFISGPIDRLGSEVMEPGWWVDAASQKTADELTEYLENVGIHGGKPRRNFARVGKQAVVQHEVRGTFMAEQVTNDDGRHNGINPVQSDTFEIYTKPGTNILLAPDDLEYDGVKETDDGDAAAFVQFDDQGALWEDRDERRFARDEVIHWPRNPDIGDIRGTSRVEAVYERARALEAKLRDNDDAIAMKAWPMVLFQMGSEDNPWNEDQMEDFMENYDDGNFGPGMYHGVPGDIDVEEFAGETADIESAVQTDVDFVITGMPGPKYALGSFAGNISTTVASAQERQYRKLVRTLRRDLEDLFTPYLVEVAKSWDLDTEDIQLHIGRPDGEVSPEDISGSIIRYTSDADSGASEGDDGGDGDDDEADQTMRENSGGSSNTDSASSFGPDEGVVEHLEAHEELADPRLVSTTDTTDELTDVVETVFTRVRDDLVDDVRGAVQNGETLSPQTIDSMSRRAFSRVRDDVGLERAVRDELEVVAKHTLQTMGQPNHTPTIEQTYGVSHQQLVDHQASLMVRDVRDAADEMASTVRQHAEGMSGSESIDRWEERVLDDLSASDIEQRARIIPHMRTQTVVNKVKLTEYERHDDVAGIEVANSCTKGTTDLCKQLAGCGVRNGAEAYFDAEDSIGEQLASQVTADLYSGFKPLPDSPPFHHRCSSELLPILDGGER